MKKRNLIRLYILLFLAGLFTAQLSAQVAINQDNSTPDPSAMLDVKSADKGVLVPRLTSAQRAAVASPAVGLLVFDTDTESFWFRDSTAWVEIRGGNVAPQGLLLGEDCFFITNLGASSVHDPGLLSNEEEISLWQSFTAESSGYLTEVEIAITGPLSVPFDNGTFRLYQGEGTSGTLLFEKNINETWNAGWHGTAIPFDSIYLSEGSVYTINFIDPDDFTWDLDYENPYAGGRASSSAEKDFDFKIFLSTCELHYVFDPPTTLGTTNLNHIDTIFFADGNILASIPTQLADADRDTKIQLEESLDEDLIRFDLEGKEYFRMEQGRLVFLNSTSVAIGENTGITGLNTNGRNTYIGQFAGQNATFGAVANTAIGYGALKELQNTVRNSALGESSLSNNSTGSRNVGVGHEAGFSNQTGHQNVFIGAEAGKFGIDKSNNVAIGFQAGLNNEENNNIFLGYHAGRGSSGSNKLYIENSGSNSPLIYGEFDNDLLRINGTLNINNAFAFPTADGAAGQVLVTDGAGLLSWMDKTVDTDDQTLSLSGTTLSITDGNSVDLAAIGTGTDDQTLSLSGTTLSIADGNSVDLASIDTDDQTLSLSGTTLSIVDGNSVDLSALIDDNDWTASGSDLYCLNTGNVGIGTNTPSDKLHIKRGDLQISNITSAPSIKLVDEADESSWTLRHQRTKDQFEVLYNEDPTPYFKVQANGYVGIGLGVNASSNLHVKGNVRIEDGTQQNNYVLTSTANGTASWQDPQSLVTDTDDQTLSLSGTTLSIQDGNSVDLSSIDTDTDDQTLSLSGTTLSIADGNSVDLISIDTDTDDQTLNLSGTTLSIADGNSVDLSTLPGDNLGTHTASQTLNLNGNYLSGDGDNEGVFVATNGNVGIGTTTPTRTLDVNGVIRATNPGNSPEGSSIEFTSPSNYPGIVFRLGDGVGGELRRWDFRFDATGSLELNDRTNTKTVLKADNTGVTVNGTMTATAFAGDGSGLTGIIPVGVIQMWPTATPPTGWLICDGSTFSAATYPELNTVLGGNTLPNFKGRFPLGANFPVAPGGYPHQLGSTGGEEEHTLTVAEMPSHSHTITYSEGLESGNSTPYSDLSGTGETDSTGNAGGGEPHNNMPPFYTINFIIKAQ